MLVPIFLLNKFEHVHHILPNHQAGWTFRKLLTRYYTYNQSIESSLYWLDSQRYQFAFAFKHKSDSDPNPALQPIAGIAPKYTRYSKGNALLSVCTASQRYLNFGFATVPRSDKHQNSTIANFLWMHGEWNFISFAPDSVKHPMKVETFVRAVVSFVGISASDFYANSQIESRGIL